MVHEGGIGSSLIATTPMLHCSARFPASSSNGLSSVSLSRNRQIAPGQSNNQRVPPAWSIALPRGSFALSMAVSFEAFKRQKSKIPVETVFACLCYGFRKNTAANLRRSAPKKVKDYQAHTCPRLKNEEQKHQQIGQTVQHRQNLSLFFPAVHV